MESPMRDLFDQAEEDKRVSSLNITIYQFAELGDSLVGIFVSCEDLPESKFDTRVRRYVLETDSGLMSCILGSAADKELQGKLAPGDLLCITFRGQKDIGGGKTVNLWDIRRASPPELPPAKAPASGGKGEGKPETKRG